MTEAVNFSEIPSISAKLHDIISQNKAIAIFFAVESKSIALLFV
jgi:hypothetical protein